MVRDIQISNTNAMHTSPLLNSGSAGGMRGISNHNEEAVRLDKPKKIHIMVSL